MSLYDRSARVVAIIADKLRTLYQRLDQEPPADFDDQVHLICHGDGNRTGVIAVVDSQGWDDPRLKKWTEAYMQYLQAAKEGHLAETLRVWEESATAFARTRYRSVNAVRDAFARITRHLNSKPELAPLQRFLATYHGLMWHPQVARDLMNDLVAWDELDRRRGRLRGFHGYGNDNEVPPDAA